MTHSVDDLTSDPAAAAVPGSSVRSRARGAVRSVVSAVLVVLGLVAALLTPPAIWARDLVLDTERYTQTLAPVARDPGVQAAVVAEIDRQFAAHLDLAALAGQVLPGRVASILAAPLQKAANSFVHDTAADFVAGPRFAALWDAMNRVTHAELVRVLTGHPPRDGVVQIRRGILVIDLTPVVSAVRTRLVAAGLTVAAAVPVTGAVLRLAEVRTIEQARTAAKLLNSLAVWLPWIALGGMAGGVLAARRRRRTALVVSAGVAVAMALLFAGLAVGRHMVVGSVPADLLDHGAVTRLYDALVRYLRAGIRSLLVLALLVLAAVWATGPSAAALAARAAVARSGRRMRAALAGVPPAYRRPVEAAVLAIAVLVLVLTTDPAPGLVIGVLVVAALVVAALELTRPGESAAPSSQAAG